MSAGWTEAFIQGGKEETWSVSFVSSPSAPIASLEVSQALAREHRYQE